MLKQIIKRDGKKQKYDFQKIEKAVFSASGDCKYVEDYTLIPRMLEQLRAELETYDTISVEGIQDMIFIYLCRFGLFRVAQCFEAYRTRRTIARDKKLEKVYNDMDRILKQGSTENSNKNSILLGVKRDLIAGEFFRNSLSELLPKPVYDAHCKKLIHWHDSDYEIRQTNCSIVNVQDMLEHGTRVTNANIGTPNSVQVASNVIMQIMASVSASQYGGVSIGDFNELLAKYAKKNFVKNMSKIAELLEIDMEVVKKECGEIDSANNKLEAKYPKLFAKTKEYTDKDIYDACQLFEYQTNSILGSASQTPFSTITFTIPTSWESERVIWHYLDVRMKGLGDGIRPSTIAIFPKISMIVVDGYNLKEGDPYYYLLEKASECIAKTYYPDILNYTPEEYLAGKTYARMG